jgi:uncharacterized SAM-binding protein YcdF (DUF218 family)
VDADLLARAVCRALVLPPGGPLIVGALGLALFRRRPRLGRALVGLALGVLLALSLPITATLLTESVERYPPLAPPWPAADVIVVLGGGITRGTPAVPSAASLERLAYGAGLARATGLPLFLSGGIVDGAEAEAQVMQRSLHSEFGLEARWLETRSRTTEENARESVPMLRALGLRRVLLVTSAVHMPRSVAEFHAAGLEVIPTPVGASEGVALGLRAWLPSATALARSQAALYELAGRLVAVLGGRG